MLAGALGGFAVLSSKHGIGAVGANKIQKLEHDGHYTRKKTGPVRSFHQPRYTGLFYSKAVAVRIEFRHAWREDIVRAEAFEKGQIVLQCARISIEILRVVELRGIHEDAGHDDFILAAATLDQRGMPPMERTHSGNEADAAPGDGFPPLKPGCDRV